MDSELLIGVLYVVLGIVFYFLYSRSHSRLGRTQAAEGTAERS